MTIYHWILLISFSALLISVISVLVKILAVNKIKDFSVPKGNNVPAIIYSFSGAMSPFKKESAYLHIPTYTAGMIFHIGTFLSMFLIVLFFFKIQISSSIFMASLMIISASVICGISILIKRIVKIQLRELSNPDDYFSNLLVTGFQILVAISLFSHFHIFTFSHFQIEPVLFVYSSFLLIYIPIGKLKHSIYFFSSRIFLGKYYGTRGVWK